MSCATTIVERVGEWFDQSWIGCGFMPGLVHKHTSNSES